MLGRLGLHCVRGVLVAFSARNIRVAACLHCLGVHIRAGARAWHILFTSDRQAILAALGAVIQMSRGPVGIGIERGASSPSRFFPRERHTAQLNPDHDAYHIPHVDSEGVPQSTTGR